MARREHCISAPTPSRRFWQTWSQTPSTTPTSKWQMERTKDRNLRRSSSRLWKEVGNTRKCWEKRTFLVPSPVRGLNAYPMNPKSDGEQGVVALVWKKPRRMNGKLQKYVVSPNLSILCNFPEIRLINATSMAVEGSSTTLARRSRLIQTRVSTESQDSILIRTTDSFWKEPLALEKEIRPASMRKRCPKLLLLEVIFSFFMRVKSSHLWK